MTFFCKFKTITFFVLFSVVGVTVTGQSIPKLSAGEARYDIRRLEYVVFDAHINIPYVVDTSQLRADFKTLLESIQDSIGTSELYLKAAKVFYTIQDAHCALMLPDDCNDYLADDNLYLPLKPIFQNGKMWLESVYKDTVPGFSEILKINDHSATEILAALLPYTSADGAGIFTKNHMSSNFFIRMFPLLFEVKEENKIIFCTTGDTSKFILKGIRGNDPGFRVWTKKTDNESRPYRIRFSENKEIAIMRIADFTSGNPGEYERFLRDAFAMIAKLKTSTLIIDLRDNTGGYADRGMVLCQYLFSHPFSYTCNLQSKASKSIRQELIRQSPLQRELFLFVSKNFGSESIKGIWKLKPGEKLNFITKAVKPVKKGLVFNGDLYLMMNGYSASTSGLVINTLGQREKTETVGEPAGCLQNGTFGQPTEFELPNSGIVGYISILRFNQDCFSNKKEVITPSIDYSLIPYFSANKKQDPWMNKLLNEIRQKDITPQPQPGLTQ